MHPCVLKECADDLNVPLTELFRRSFSEMHVPVDWKNTDISAVFKKGDRTIISAYCPIILIMGCF